MPATDHHAIIYTDGSCHTQLLTGSWVAIVFTGQEKHLLSGIVQGTTHNRMELTAVIEAVKYLATDHKNVTTIEVISDSQYVTGLPERGKQLQAAGFLTKKGKEIQNADLVKLFLLQTEQQQVIFTKIKAHQKKSDAPNYNIEADKLVRKLLREAVKKNET